MPLQWVPDLVLQSHYPNWDDFIDACYAFYVADFIRSNPSFDGVKVESKRRDAIDGKDHSFWHCIQEKDKGKPKSEANRHVKVELAERIRWPRPIIERAKSEPEILVWEENFHGHGATERVHMYLKPLKYAVVLEPRKIGASGKPDYYFLWTTFLCTYQRQVDGIMRRYHRNSGNP